MLSFEFIFASSSICGANLMGGNAYLVYFMLCLFIFCGIGGSGCSVSIFTPFFSYCTSNFSLFLCQPSPLWCLWIEAENRRKAVSSQSRNAYIWSSTPRRYISKYGRLWFVKRGDGRRKEGGSRLPTITCVCVCVWPPWKEASMPNVCVSLSQIVSHSVSSYVCVRAVAERNSLRGKKRGRVKGREEKMMMVVMMMREEQRARLWRHKCISSIKCTLI